MNDGGRLRVFSQAWGRPVAAPDMLAQTIDRLLDEVAGRWPEFAHVHSSDEARFLVFVAERLDPREDPTRQIASRSGADLYLAFACLEGSERAKASFFEHVLADVATAVERVVPRRTERVMQQLYERLFLPSNGAPAKICQYRGDVDLRGWVRVVAVRLALDMRRHVRFDPSGDGLVAKRLGQSVEGHEFAYMRAGAGAAFDEAFSRALGELSVRERAVVRQHAGGLCADEIARLYHVHRVTVTRWLSRARRTLLARVRLHLRDERSGAVHESESDVRHTSSGEANLGLEHRLASSFA